MLLSTGTNRPKIKRKQTVQCFSLILKSLHLHQIIGKSGTKNNSIGMSHTLAVFKLPHRRTCRSTFTVKCATSDRKVIITVVVEAENHICCMYLYEWLIIVARGRKRDITANYRIECCCNK